MAMGVVTEVTETKDAALKVGLDLATKIARQAPLAVRETLKSANMVGE